MITPQKVFWGPRDGRPAGIRIIEDDREETHFISWSDLERELQRCLLPQLFADPTGFSFVTRDYHGKPDWLVQIVDGQGAWYCDVWLGVNPDNGWSVDGMVHFGEPDHEPRVWQS